MAIGIAICYNIITLDIVSVIDIDVIVIHNNMSLIDMHINSALINLYLSCLRDSMILCRILVYMIIDGLIMHSIANQGRKTVFCFWF